ncbi:MAG TPA: M1 family metallopeptidase, partial [Polyangiaceae bacterium]|nr:M1 family metallopeptidase [Polyangiaceae bacterium]
MIRWSPALAFALGAITACHGQATSAPVAGPAPASSVRTPSAAQAAAAPEAPRADVRLPATVIPRHYALSLRIDPTQPHFSGSATIDVTVTQPTSRLILHARDMSIRRATVRAGDVTRPAATSSRVPHGGVEPEELVLATERPIPAGPAEIAIAFDAPFASDLAGVYRVEEGGRTYAYTQFEVADARRAFPCFDEPSHKTPFDIAITAPGDATVVANTPEASRADAGDGMVEHRFATSPPLPTYLVAFAVGDFDVVEWQKDPFPIRAVTTKGRGGLTGLGLQAAAALVAHLAGYFDLPYPYAKLDLVAVPDFAAGGMENAGLVMLRDSLLLLDARRATAAARRAQTMVIAHELAHQWLGDLVTMTWWDDVWLNEAFATWAGAKVVDAWRPSFSATLEQIASADRVMDTDAL